MNIEQKTASTTEKIVKALIGILFLLPIVGLIVPLDGCKDVRHKRAIIVQDGKCWKARDFYTGSARFTGATSLSGEIEFYGNRRVMELSKGSKWFEAARALQVDLTTCVDLPAAQAEEE